MNAPRDFGHGIHAIDAGYERPDLASIHVVLEGRDVVVVDTGTNASVPRVEVALAALGRTFDDVRYVFLTHIHLDHAGGAGALLARCPHAQLVVHPRGVRHMEDPAKLWQGTVAVYGEDEAERLYGKLVPIAPSRILPATNELELVLGTRRFRFMDTPGHARHHVAIADALSGHVFAGDTFGLSYRELDERGMQFIIPTSSPTQFDPDAAHASIDRIHAAATGGAVYLTHFSQVRDLGTLAAALHRLIDRYRELALAHAAPSADRLARLRAGMRAIVIDEARRRGFTHSEATLDAVLALDIDLNAQGLIAWLDQR